MTDKVEIWLSTVNAILLKCGDRVLIDAMRDKRALGWTLAEIAKYYNVYNEFGDERTIPAELYKEVQ